MKSKVQSMNIKTKIRILIMGMLLFCWSFSSIGQTTDVQMVVLDLNDNITYDDLWNINIVSTANGDYQNFFIHLVAYEQQAGQLFSAQSKAFSIAQGITLFTASNYYSVLQPSINFTSYSNCNSLIQSGGYFPAGNYTFVYELYGLTNNSSGNQIPEIAATYTLNKTIGLFFPPMLLDPENEHVFNLNETGNVIFCWTPAFIQDNSATISYTVNVYQMYNGQTPEQAVISNPTYISESNLSTTCYIYPSAAQSFNDSVEYAWQVKAYNGSAFLAETEVWTFKFYNPPRKSSVIVDTTVVTPTYYIMLEQLNSTYAEDVTHDSLGNKNNFLRFIFSEPYNIEDTINLKYSILNNSTYEKVENLPIEKVKYHDNFYEINFDLLDIPYGYYILEVTDMRNIKWYLRFLFDEGTTNEY